MQKICAVLNHIPLKIHFFLFAKNQSKSLNEFKGHIVWNKKKENIGYIQKKN